MSLDFKKFHFFHNDEESNLFDAFVRHHVTNAQDYITQQISQLPLFQQINNKAVIDNIKTKASIFDACETILVLGTGGSSLAGQTLCALPPVNPNNKRIIFVDNIDPQTFFPLLDSCAIDKTGVVAISKSGETTETLMQFLYVIDWFKTHNITLKNQCLGITTLNGSTKNSMQLLCEANEIALLEHPADIGGRFSVFTCVGLLPAYLHGLDIDALNRGALDVLKHFETAPEDILLGGISIYCMAHDSKNLSIMMPYMDQLKFFALWYRQLTAESLGKNEFGITPINAHGTVDQHSQLQLYLDGPKDKFFTIIGMDKNNSCKALELDESQQLTANLSAFHGKSMRDLIYAHQMGTYKTFEQLEMPARYIELSQLNEYTMGQLLAYFMIETLVVAGCAKINPFDQNAVEQSKVLAKKYFN